MFDAFKIAVQISLIDTATAGIKSIARELSAADKASIALTMRIVDLKERIRGLNTEMAKFSAMRGMGSALTSIAKTMAVSLKVPLDAAKELQIQTKQFEALNFGQKVNDEAMTAARGMNYMGLSIADNLKLIKEASTITGSFEDGVNLAPVLAKMSSGIAAVMTPGQGAEFDEQIKATIKTMEQRGALTDRVTGKFDEAKAELIANKITQAYVASGGLIKPSDYLAFSKTAGVAGKQLDNDAFFFGMAHFMQENGASRTGTGIMSMYSNWEQGKMTKKTKEALAAQHLLDKDGRIKHAEEFAKNPFEATQQYIVQPMKDRGDSLDKITRTVADLVGIRTAQNLLDEFNRDYALAHRYTETANRAANVDQLMAIGATSLQGQENDLHAKWIRLMSEIGTVILPMAIDGLKELNPKLQALADWVSENPEKVKAVTLALGGLTGALALLGLTLGGMGIIGLYKTGRALAIARESLAAAQTAKTLLGVGARVGGAAEVAGIGAAEMAAGGAAAGVAGGVAARSGITAALAFLGSKGIIGLAAAAVVGGGYLMYQHYSKDGKEKSVAKPAEPEQKINLEAVINMDGRKVSDIVTSYQVKGASRPLNGTTKFDGGMAPIYPIGGGSW